jgi:hypothetical protein
MVLARYAGRVATGARCDGDSEADMEQTLRTNVTVAEAHDARLGGLSLHCPDGSSRAGSFEVLVIAMIRDAVAKGGAVDAVVYAEKKPQSSRVQRYDGRITNVCDGPRTLIEFEDGEVVDLEEVVSIFI